MSEKDLFVTLGEDITKDCSEMANHNEIAEARVEKCFKSLSEMFAGEPVQITKSLHKPFKGSGVITILGKDILVRDPGNFAVVCGYANNVDIYPKTDGNVQIDLSFHGLMCK